MSDEITSQEAMSKALMAISEAAKAHEKIMLLEPGIVGARLKADTAAAQISGISTLLITYGKQITDMENDQDLCNGEIGDLHLCLSATNERLETLELMMSMQTTAPIAAATDVEAELVDQLITAESQLEAVNGQLDQALQLIHDIRKRARETGAMNTNEWMDLGQRSVAILELHKLI